MKERWIDGEKERWIDGEMKGRRNEEMSSGLGLGLRLG